jgi:hypothetical protein
MQTISTLLDICARLHPKAFCKEGMTAPSALTNWVIALPVAPAATSGQPVDHSPRPDVAAPCRVFIG